MSMGDTYTDHLTPVKLNQYETSTSVDFGNRFYMRIPNEHAHLLSVNQPADITYDEWVGRNGKTNYTITAVNGQSCRQQRGQPQNRPQGGQGGPAARAGGGGGPAARAAAKPAPAASGGAYEGAWAGMGPENRARMVADAFVRDMYKGTGNHPGVEALAQDFRLTYQAWLQGCEGRQPAGGAQPSYGNGSDEGYEDGDPGPGGDADYV